MRISVTNKMSSSAALLCALLTVVGYANGLYPVIMSKWLFHIFI